MNYYCGCSNRLVKPRCTPNSIDETALTDDNFAILVDDYETGLLIGLTRSGSGVEFEYNRQETT
jgi:hypothetical protein